MAAMPLTTMAQGKFVKFFQDRQILPATSYVSRDIKIYDRTTKTYSPAKTPEKKYSWFNHLDFAITGGTSGIGFDLAVPMSEWAQLRVGGVFRPLRTYTATFTTEMAGAYTEEEINSKFSRMSSLMKSFTNVIPDRSIQMSGDLKMNNFKMLVDFFPIQKHRNFHVTVGFYYGNSTLIEANTRTANVKTLAAINTFNNMYKKALAKENMIDVSAIAEDVKFDKPIEKLRNWGAIAGSEYQTTSIDQPATEANREIAELMKDLGLGDGTYETVYYTATNRMYEEHGLSIGLGRYKHDMVAQEDVYYDYSMVLDQPILTGFDGQENQYQEYAVDANGRPIIKGQLRYKKGEVMHRAGDPVRLTPDELNQLSAKSTVNKFKPYIGVGYSLPITKDKRTCFSFDAGVMFWGGTPSVDVRVPSGVDAAGNQLYTNLNLVKDATDMPKKVNDYISTIKSYPVFPEVSVRISQRLW